MEQARERSHMPTIGSVIGALVQYVLAVVIGFYLSAGAESAVVISFVLMSMGLTACARTSTHHTMVRSPAVRPSPNHPSLHVVLARAASSHTAASIPRVDPVPVRERALASQAS